MAILDVQIEGNAALDKLGATLPQTREAIRGLLSRASTDFANSAVSTIKRDYLSGGADKLKVRTGRLRSSIRYVIGESENEINITFGSDIIYAAIHEFGGKTQPHRIETKRKKALHFMRDGRDVFAMVVNHPGSRIPARPFLTPGVSDEVPAFQEAIGALLERAATQGIQ
jgi:phage gpG-like protein